MCLSSQKGESFYTLSWACDHVDSAAPLLVVGGCSGIIRVINCATEKIAKVQLVYISIAKLNEAWFAQNNTSVTYLIHTSSSVLSILEGDLNLN